VGSELARLQKEAGRWSDQTFGKQSIYDEDAGVGAINHLRKEVGELLDEMDDITEWADCLMLLLDGARRRGIDIDAIVDATWDKLEVNRQRKWGKPDADGVVEHVRT
jgi:hypothetical protein